MSKCGKPTKRAYRRAPRTHKVKHSNVRLQNYLEEHGAILVDFDYEYNYYERTAYFVSLLDSYWIQYECIPNRV